MSQLFNVNASNIVGGPGRLIAKQFDGEFPETIADVMNRSSYALQPGYFDLGATVEGITMGRGFDKEDFEVDQLVAPVDYDITSWENTLETTLAENTVENRQLALAGGQIIETPAELGTATTLTAGVTAGVSAIAVTSAAGITANSFVNLSEGETSETVQVARVQGTNVYLKKPLLNAFTTASEVAPVESLGTKRVGYGAVDSVPDLTYVLISQKKDGTLQMVVIRKAMLSGDASEQTWQKEKRVLPLSLMARPVEGIDPSENIYYEIEETL